MLKSNYEFEVLVNGHGAKEYYHNGNYYVEGKEGSRFSLKMRNNSGHRVLFVPTVDGLSIMSGKEASFRSRGYIVNSHDSLTIDGWRTSDDKVAEFYFSKPKESYASKISKGGNLGVIGCAVFKEKERVKIIEKVIKEKEYIPVPYPVYPQYPNPWYWATYTTDSSQPTYTTTSSGWNGTNTSTMNYVGTSATGSANMKTSIAGLGTGFGGDKYSPVVKVEFDQEESPIEVFTLYYNTRENLEAAGVEFRKAVYVTPSAFPNEDGYCEKP